MFCVIMYNYPINIGILSLIPVYLVAGGLKYYKIKLCLDVRGYYSRRFHVQLSFGHVFQVLIKLYGSQCVK